MNRGEIYVASLLPRSGSEQQGQRPVLVVSHDGFNHVATWRSVIVVPLSTSSSQGKRGPTSVPLPKGAGGLAQDSFALCHQITTLDRQKLQTLLGTLPPELQEKVDEGLRIALDLAF